MYIIPLVLIVLLALAIFASPIFALILFAVFLLGLGVVKFLGRGIASEHESPHNEIGSPTNVPDGTMSGEHDEAETGLWGEKWPEQQAGEKAR
jgi:hypothetical protein